MSTKLILALCLGTAALSSPLFADKDVPANIRIARFAPLGNMGIFHPGQTPELDLELAYSGPAKTQFKLTVSVTDFWTKPVYKHSETIIVNSGEATRQRIVIPEPKNYGFYSVTTEITKDGVLQAQETASFCRVARMSKPNPFFGISLFGLGDRRADRAIGVGTAGFCIHWRDVPLRNGTYDFSGVDTALQGWLDLGIRPIGYIDPRYIPQYSTPDRLVPEVEAWQKDHKTGYPDSYYEAWGEFVRQVVTHFKNRIRTWSCIGELDIMPYDQADAMVRLFQVQAKATKDVDPSCTIGGVGITGYGWTAAERLWPELADYFDGQFFDPYILPCAFGPGYNSPGDEKAGFRNMLLRARDLIAKYGKNKLAVEEKGFKITTSLPVDDPYAKLLAKTVSRSFIIAKSVPEVDRYCYFMSNCDEGGMDYDLWKGACPRPSVAAYATTARMLMDTSEPIEVNVHKDINIYVFKKGDGSIAAIWTPLAAPVSLLTSIPKDAAFYDLMGNKMSKPSTGKNDLLVTNSPVFMISGLGNHTLASGLAKAKCVLPEVTADIKLRSTNTVDLHVSNLTAHSLDARVRMLPFSHGAWKKPEFTVTVPAREILVIPAPLGTGDFLSNGNAHVSCNIITSANRDVVISKDIVTYAAKKINAGVTQDADLSKYRNIQPIVMDSPKWIYPSGGDAVSNKIWTGPDDLSMKVWVTWDESKFYFAAEVTSREFIQDSVGTNIWMGDGFQIAFDSKCDAIDPDVSGKGIDYGDDDYEYGLALTKEGPQGFCWRAAKVNPGMVGKLTEFVPAIKRIDDHTVNYEWAIPWEKLAPLKPIPGTAFGFNICHRLHPSKPGEVSNYYMGLGMGIYGGKNPSLFPTFFLTK